MSVQVKQCKWKYDEWGEVWRTECENAQEFLEGGVKDNRYKFCPYCGRKIVVNVKQLGQFLVENADADLASR